MEDGKALGKLLGREVETSLGKRLGLEAGTVFVGLEDGVKARLLAMEDSCELLVLMSGGMQGLEDGKALGRSLGTVDSASLGKMLGLEDGTVSDGLEDGTILGKTEDGT